MDHIKLVSDPIDISSVYNLIVDAGCGASSVFVGTTRDTFQGKKVISLEYEAYEPMALKEIKTICTSLRLRWPGIKHIVVYHRLGSVPVSEASVVIAASAPHRAEALESVVFAVDQLKSRVPIWKKEMYEDDHVGEWKENSESLRPNNLRAPESNFNLSDCKVHRELETVPDNLVQIRVLDDELGNRVDCFVKRKRVEINSHNIRDFTQQQTLTGSNAGVEEVSCARTQSAVVKQEQSNCHLKVRRAYNHCGPQQIHLRPNYALELNKLMLPNDNMADLSLQIRNDAQVVRLKNIEEYMGVCADDNENIIDRVKRVENRILLLESISPEYKHFTNFWQTDLKKECANNSKRKQYCADELSNVLRKIKNISEP